MYTEVYTISIKYGGYYGNVLKYINMSLIDSYMIFTTRVI